MKSFESFDARVELTKEMMAVRNDLQLTLMLKGCPPEKSEARDRNIDEWYSTHKAERFEELFSALERKRQNLVSEYEDLNKREEIIAELREQLESSESSAHADAA